MQPKTFLLQSAKTRFFSLRHHGLYDHFTSWTRSIVAPLKRYSTSPLLLLLLLSYTHVNTYKWYKCIRTLYTLVGHLSLLGNCLVLYPGTSESILHYAVCYLSKIIHCETKACLSCKCKNRALGMCLFGLKGEGMLGTMLLTMRSGENEHHRLRQALGQTLETDKSRGGKRAGC